MHKIAITGGIGSGKSTVTKYLQDKGFIVIDADRMARELTEPGGRAIPYILENFGNEYISPNGSMNRAKMRDLIFRDYSKKAILEEGTTKVVLEDIDKIIRDEESKGNKVVFFDIPLLFENKLEGNYEEVWVVTADNDIRKERVMKRDNIDDNIVDLIIGSQAEEDYKISKADAVIRNNGTIEELYKIVDSLISHLL